MLVEPRRLSSRVIAATCPVSLVQCRPHRDNEPTGNGNQRKLHSRRTLFYFFISFLCVSITLHYFLNLSVSCASLLFLAILLRDLNMHYCIICYQRFYTTKLYGNSRCEIYIVRFDFSDSRYVAFDVSS